MLRTSKTSPRPPSLTETVTRQRSHQTRQRCCCYDLSQLAEGKYIMLSQSIVQHVARQLHALVFENRDDFFLNFLTKVCAHYRGDLEFEFMCALSFETHGTTIQEGIGITTWLGEHVIRVLQTDTVRGGWIKLY